MDDQKKTRKQQRSGHCMSSSSHTPSEMPFSKCKGHLEGKALIFCALTVCISLAFTTIVMVGCSALDSVTVDEADRSLSIEDRVEEEEISEEERLAREAEAQAAAELQAETEHKARIDEALSRLDLSQDLRNSFVHGDKPAEFQKYIVLHDTEGNSSASSVINWWDSNGAGVAAHFVVNKDGSIVQAVPLDKIAHHAGYGDTGHNAEFGIVEDGRDDMVGTVPIGSWASDYAMNGASIGIEIVHVGGSGDYPLPQLEALDDLIAYIDAYYGFESQITDHKAWRTGNSDTSKEFASYFENYKTTRTHDGVTSTS